MAIIQSLCPHPLINEQTTWYEVPCGIPIDDPEKKAVVRRAYQVADAQGRDIPLMLRAWCPVCRTWKEPLLSIDGTHYFGDELS
jgi:hypothetical protein